jgi:hypothetical protein
MYKWATYKLSSTGHSREILQAFTKKEIKLGKEFKNKCIQKHENCFKMTIKEAHDILFGFETYRRYIICNNQEDG